MTTGDGSEKGIGAFFYPTVLWVTDSESPLIMDDKLKPPGQKVRRIATTHQLADGKKIIVTDDGFIGLFSMAEKEATNILNTIFAVSVTYGIGGDCHGNSISSLK